MDLMSGTMPLCTYLLYKHILVNETFQVIYKTWHVKLTLCMSLYVVTLDTSYWLHVFTLDICLYALHCTLCRYTPHIWLTTCLYTWHMSLCITLHSMSLHSPHHTSLHSSCLTHYSHDTLCLYTWQRLIIFTFDMFLMPDMSHYTTLLIFTLFISHALSVTYLVDYISDITCRCIWHVSLQYTINLHTLHFSCTIRYISLWLYIWHYLSSYMTCLIACMSDTICRK